VNRGDDCSAVWESRRVQAHAIVECVRQLIRVAEAVDERLKREQSGGCGEGRGRSPVDHLGAPGTVDGAEDAGSERALDLVVVEVVVLGEGGALAVAGDGERHLLAADAELAGNAVERCEGELLGEFLGRLGLREGARFTGVGGLGRLGATAAKRGVSGCEQERSRDCDRDERSSAHAGALRGKTIGASAASASAAASRNGRENEEVTATSTTSSSACSRRASAGRSRGVGSMERKAGARSGMRPGVCSSRWPRAWAIANPGFQANNRTVVTCTFTGPRTGSLYTVSGILT